jgi:hypothetical protein
LYGSGNECTEDQFKINREMLLQASIHNLNENDMFYAELC